MNALHDYDDGFTPARRLRPFEDVANQIAERIQSGVIRSGERLPAERELCESFGVSRPTLREALRGLEALGIVETRAGAHGGTFAVVPSVNHIADALSTLVNLKGATSQHLDELRASFEPENAWWAAARRDDDDLARLNRLVAIAGDDSRPPDANLRLGDADAQWHEAIAAATKNPLRVGISRGIHNAVTRQVRALRVIPRRALEDHSPGPSSDHRCNREARSRQRPKTDAEARGLLGGAASRSCGRLRGRVDRLGLSQPNRRLRSLDLS